MIIILVIIFLEIVYNKLRNKIPACDWIKFSSSNPVEIKSNQKEKNSLYSPLPLTGKCFQLLKFGPH